MGKSDKVSIIIPAYFIDWSFFDMTRHCVDTIVATSKPDEIFVVDDGSPFEILVEDSDARYIKRKVNGGYAAAVNTGLFHASGDILIICNNDIEFIQSDWLDHLLYPLKHWNFDISSIRTSDSDGWLTENRLEEGAKFGSIWAMKSKVYETIGGLDESFGKGYFEDLDYQKRAEDAGFRVVKNHAGIVEHIGKATFKEIDPDDTAFKQARQKFIKKWGKVW